MRLLYSSRHSFTSVARASLTSLMLTGLVTGAAQANVGSTKTTTVLDFSLETLLTAKDKDPWNLTSLGLLKKPVKSDLNVPENARIAPQPDAPFYLSVDGYKGVPVVRYPILVAPGTNGMQPDLSLQIGGALGADAAGFGARLTVPQSIETCAEGYCLGDSPLIPVKGAAKDTVFALRHDPRISIHKSDAGFLLKNDNGVNQYYTAPSVETLETGPWEINAVSDWFENYILYRYDADGRVAAILYGQDRSDKKNLRKIHFTYSDGTLARIDTGVADQNLRTYYIGKNGAGRISSITECAGVQTSEPVCYRPYQVNWETGQSGQQALLSSVLNGIGGQTRIRYTSMPGGKAVSSLILMTGSEKMQENLYHFAKPQMKGEKRLGFGEFRTTAKKAPIGNVTQYGGGKYAGVVIREGVFVNDSEKGLKAQDIQSTEEVIYSFKEIGQGADAPYVLGEIEKRSHSHDGRQTETETQSFDYDAKGRVKRIVSGDDIEEITYLDETEPAYAGQSIGNLISVKSVTRNQETRTKKWTYGFEKGVLVSSKIAEYLTGKLIEGTEKAYKLDRHGNALSISRDEDEVSITYDEKFASFPVRMTSPLLKELAKRELSFDPATGQSVQETYSDGSSRRTFLDTMRNPVGAKTVLADPDEGIKKEDRKLVILNDKTQLTTLENGDIQKVVTVEKLDETSGQKISEINTEHKDTVGQITLQVRETVDEAGKRTLHHRRETIYREHSKIETLTTEDGAKVVTETNDKGQVVFTEDSRYGTARMAYNNRGQLATLRRADEEINYHYDEEGRLTRKILPGGGALNYIYDQDFPKKIKTALLPSGKRLDFKYSHRGQVIEKEVSIPDGDERLRFVIRYHYERSRLTAVTYPDGSEIKYTYDDGRLDRINWVKSAPDGWKDLQKPIVRYEPDVMPDGGRVLFRYLANDVLETYQWNPDGKLGLITASRLQDPENEHYKPFSTVAYKSDGDSRRIMTEQRVLWGRKGRDDRLRNYSYDEQGRLNSYDEKINGKVTARQSFERFNKREKINRSDPATINILGRKVDITYDKFGNINSRSVGDLKSEYQFNIENQLLKSLVSDGLQTTVTDYEVDHKGQRLEKRDADGTVTYYISPFYEFILRPDSSMQETRYVLDHMGRIAAFTNEVDNFDTLGSLLPASGQGEDGSSAGHRLSDVLASSLAEIDRIWSSSSMIPVRPLLPLFVLFVLMASGLFLFHLFLFRRYESGQHAGAAVIRPAFATVSGLVIVTFLTVTLAPTAHAALEAGDGTPKVRQTTYFHRDIRGSVIAVSDENGNQTASVSYHPYGQIEDSPFTAGNNNFRYKFAGLEHDQAADLINGNARAYDSRIGKYLSVDPARTTADPYAYTEGDPVNFVDINGRMQGQPPEGDIAKDTWWSRFKNYWRGRGTKITHTELVEERDEGDPNTNMVSTDTVLVSNQENVPTGEPLSSDDIVVTVDDSDRDVAAQGDSWVRYPTFWRVYFGRHSRPSAPSPDYVEPAPLTKDEIREFNQYARRGYTMGMTRTGGYIQSLFSAFILASVFPLSERSQSSIVNWGIDFGVYGITATIFSALGKYYTFNESQYWAGVKKRPNPRSGAGVGATWRDYAVMAIRRLLVKGLMQMGAFTGAAFLGRAARKQAIIEQSFINRGRSFKEAVVLQVLHLMYRYGWFSIGGTLPLLPYYLMTKDPRAEYDTDMGAADFKAMPWWKRWIVKASIAYRKFNRRQGFWARDFQKGTWSHWIQKRWYLWYVLQMYGQYALGSIGYYSMLAAFYAMVGWPVGGLAYWGAEWARNAIIVAFSPAASFFAYANAWTRYSFTLFGIRKQSEKNPRRGGFWFIFLGPTDGLRLFRYDDAAHLSAEEARKKLIEYREKYGSEETPLDVLKTQKNYGTAGGEQPEEQLQQLNPNEEDPLVPEEYRD